MGGARLRAGSTGRAAPRSLTPLPPVIPAQAGTHTHRTTHPPPAPSPIHPSPLPGGRLGGGCEAANHHHRSCRAPIAHAAPSVIPAQAGTHAHRTTHPPPAPSPNSSLPPSRGEVRWGVRSHKPAPPSVPRSDRLAPGIFTPIAHSAPLPGAPALAADISPSPPPTPRPPSSPIHPSPLPGGRLGGGETLQASTTSRATHRHRRSPGFLTTRSNGGAAATTPTPAADPTPASR